LIVHDIATLYVCPCTCQENPTTLTDSLKIKINQNKPAVII